MKSGEITGRLTLQSPELGLYLYDLNLTASPANPERPVHFITNLGTNQSQSCRFINYARSKVEYACKVNFLQFYVVLCPILSSSFYRNSDKLYRKRVTTLS